MDKINVELNKVYEKLQIKFRKHYRSLRRFRFIFMFILIICIISSIFYSVYFGVEIPRLTNKITIKQGEINEIKIYRENIKDIDDKYTNLVIDILEKDYEIYHSIEDMNMKQ